MSEPREGEDEDEGRLQRVHPLSPLLRGGIVLVALLLAAGRQLLEGGGSLDWPIWVVLPVVLAVFGWGLLSWWFTWFRLGPVTLRIESGILFRRSRRIRLDRVQAVEVQQPFLARLFGMAELQIETAGGETEASLAFLTHAHALDLRGELLERAGGRVQTGAEAAAPEGQAVPDEVLHRVAPGLLLVSQLARTGVLLAVVGSAVGLAMSTALGQPLGLALLVPMGLGLANAVGGGFVAQYDFMLTRTSRGLGVRAGLFGVRSQSVPIDRVQGVVVVEPIVWRWLGWCEVRVTVAGVRARGEDEARYTSTLVPVIDRDAGARLAVEALGRGGPGATTLHAAPRRARWLEPAGLAGAAARGRRRAGGQPAGGAGAAHRCGPAAQGAVLRAPPGSAAAQVGPGHRRRAPARRPGPRRGQAPRGG